MTRGPALIAALILGALAAASLPAAEAASETSAASAAAATTAAPAPASDPAPAASLSSAPVLQLHFERVEVGAMVLYRVGPPATPGVLSRESYQLRYELLRLTATEATLVRTTLTRANRELAREVFTVERHSRFPREPAPAPAAKPSALASPPVVDAAVTVAVAGQTIDAHRLRYAWTAAGRSHTREWTLSPAVPLTGLVATAIDGVPQLELLAFSNGGPAEAAALSAAAAAAAAAAQSAQATPSTVADRTASPNSLTDLPPGTLLVDPRAKTITPLPAPAEPIPAAPAPDTNAPAPVAPAPAGDIEQDLPPAP